MLVAPFPSTYLSLERNKKKEDVETLGMLSASSLDKSKMEWVKKEEELKVEKIIVVLPGNLPIKHNDYVCFAYLVK